MSLLQSDNFTYFNVFPNCLPRPHKLSSLQEPWEELPHRGSFLPSGWCECQVSQLSPNVGSLSLQQEGKKKSFLLYIIHKEPPGKYSGKKTTFLFVEFEEQNDCMKITFSPTMETSFARLNNLDSNMSPI